MTHNDASKELNALLRGELSAKETYEIALKELQGPMATELRDIASDHSLAVGQLESAVRTSGGEPSKSSGPWGLFAKAVTGTATGLGDKAVLKALKEGEEHGLKEYQEALESKDLDATTQELIRLRFMPRQQAHIQTIDSCMQRLH